MLPNGQVWFIKGFFLTIIYTQRELIKQNIVTTYLKSSVVKHVLYCNPTVQLKVEKRANIDGGCRKEGLNSWKIRSQTCVGSYCRICLQKLDVVHLTGGGPDGKREKAIDTNLIQLISFA